ncbi:MAG: hypothetical protein JWR19_1845 [Pedosphaera sp.]|nr:hypothetical protein [Pedosphaera sp.]
MRKHLRLIVVLVIATLLLSLWLWPRQKPEALPQPTLAKDSIQDHASTSSSAEAPEQKSVAKELTKPSGSTLPVPPDVHKYVLNRMADSQYDWKQPINFYGKVVDERDQPIANASAHFKWTDLSENGTSEADAQSDSSGFFSLLNRTGKRMSVTVSKAGFYTTPSENLSSFEYANPADGLFTPDSNNPIVFHLRKKGAGADLITSQNGIKNYFGVSVPLDGTTVLADLLERTAGRSGQLRISQKKPPYENWKQASEWSFRMEIPDGGFIEQNDEFPFEAPEGGYQPVVQFNFQLGQTNWSTSLKKDYYIKFGDPARYGRLHLDSSIQMGGARLTYAINPDGSRNLEPQ